MFQPANITPPEAILRELTEMQDFLNAEYSADVPAHLTARIQSLGAYMARSGKLKADAEYHYHGMVNSAIMDNLKVVASGSLTPSTLNKLVESAAKDTKYLVTLADRTNRACTHQLDAMRSILSMAKAERYFTVG